MPTKKPQLVYKKQYHDISHYVLSSNGMSVYFVPRMNTGIITTDIVYHVGSRDENHGETGLAHMLEHMLFKPTHFDKKMKRNGARSMLFERETGVILNANTWKDRTSYFFSYPKEYFEEALRIEADRMNGVILTKKELDPEQGNVLSEYDMYAGDEYFCLGEEMMSLAFRAHPYGHETIGSRTDIEDYTAEKLERFYKAHYVPNNAALIIVGDIDEAVMRKTVISIFGSLPPRVDFAPRIHIREPKQNALRTITIEKPSTKNILALGIRHAGFPSRDWFLTMLTLELLCGEEGSVLNTLLVDSNKARSVSYSIEPTYDPNIATIFITCAKEQSLLKIKNIIYADIQKLTTKRIKAEIKRVLPRILMQEESSREHSLGLASELVEYISAGAWDAFYESETILKSIGEADIHTRLKEMFTETNMIIGYSNATK